MFENLSKTKIFKRIIENAKSEMIMQNVFETTDSNGETFKIPIKSMIDILKEDEKFIVDWKTISKLPTKQNIAYAIKDYGYKLKAAFYSLQCFLTYGEYYNVLFVFCQSTAPYEIATFQYNHDQLKMFTEIKLNDLIIETHKIINCGEDPKYMMERKMNESNPYGANFENLYNY